MKSSMNCLAIVVVIAVSESKKAVSATAVAIVGIGLLSAPVEQVQAQSSLPVVSEVILSDFDFTSSGWLTDIRQSGRGRLEIKDEWEGRFPWEINEKVFPDYQE